MIFEKTILRSLNIFSRVLINNSESKRRPKERKNKLKKTRKLEFQKRKLNRLLYLKFQNLSNLLKDQIWLSLGM